VRCASYLDMPRYFFHATGERPSIDVDGIELSNDTAAVLEAEIVASELSKGHPESNVRRLLVTSESGITVADVPMLFKD
jgi:hypothetical protein